MSINPKDLEKMFEDMRNGFAPGEVLATAAAVGGRVIPDMPAATRNAKSMTAMLGGAQRIGAGVSGAAAAASGAEPTGTKAKPFAVDLSEQTCRNLAKKIAEAQTKDMPKSLLRQFMGGFGKGAGATEGYSPMGMAKRWVGQKVRGFFGGGEGEEEKGAGATEGTGANWLMDLADRNKRRFEAVQKGQKIRSPRPPLATPATNAGGATVGEAAAGAEGASGAAGALGEIAGAAAGGVLVFAELVVEGIALTGALKAFGEATVEGNRHLAKWNGNLALAMAVSDISAIQREQHMARATGGTATGLAGESRALADEFQPIAEDLTTLKNLTAITAVEIGRTLTSMLKFLDGIFGPILRATEKYMGAGVIQELPITRLFEFLETTNRVGTIQARVDAKAKHEFRAVKPESDNTTTGQFGREYKFDSSGRITNPP